MTRTLLVGTWICLAVAGAAAASPGQSASYGADKKTQNGTPGGLPGKPNDPGALVQLAERDNLFIASAAEAGVNDVWLGRLAANKGTNPDVRKFGTRLVDAHRTANTELRTLATAKRLPFASEPNARLQATIRRISKLSGAAFDRAIMGELFARQSRNRALFQRTAHHGTDPRVKAFAAKTLAMVQEHQVIARDLTLKVVATSRPRSATAGGE